MEHTKDIISHLRIRLQQPLPGRKAQEKMIGRVLPIPKVPPENAKLSAVLCLLFPKNNQLHVLLMQRREDHTAHSGQISFPGGKYEEDDENLQNTALRESVEEVGIDVTQIEILGALTPIYIPVSNFNVFPFAASCATEPKSSINSHEVASILEIPLNTLFHTNNKIKTDVVSPALNKVIPNVNAYMLPNGNIIWGATAMILSELEYLLDEFSGKAGK